MSYSDELLKKVNLLPVVCAGGKLDDTALTLKLSQAVLNKVLPSEDRFLCGYILGACEMFKVMKEEQEEKK